MEARRTKRQMPLHERIRRQHSADVRKLKEWCEENGVKYYTFKDAPFDSICVVSTFEYDVGYSRGRVVQDNDSYFLTYEDYEDYA